ncbi:MAG: hypothetical protein HRT74_07550 [Flavobacteriales bacterium]|nr:hypothetical protein [Flavobacteriales bacterium]
MEEVLDEQSGSNSASEDHRTLTDLTSNGFNVDIGEVLTEGFEIFKRDWLFMALYGVVSGILLTISVFTVIGAIILYYPLKYGYHYYIKKRDEGETDDFSMFFDGFRNHLGPLIILMLLNGLILFLPMLFGQAPNIVAQLTQSGLADIDPDVVAPILVGGVLFSWLMSLVGWVLSTFLWWSAPLVTIGNVSPMNAVKYSFKLASKQFFPIFGVYIIASILAGLGVVACIIGVIVTAPLLEVMRVASYKKVLGYGDRSGE